MNAEPKNLAYFWKAVFCKRCGRNMGARWNVHGKRIFCSNACRQAAYRERKEVSKAHKH